MLASVVLGIWLKTRIQRFLGFNSDQHHKYLVIVIKSTLSQCIRGDIPRYLSPVQGYSKESTLIANKVVP